MNHEQAVHRHLAATIRKAKPCPHCRGVGSIVDYQHGATPCWMCNGTGGPAVTKMAYNLHRG